LIFHRNRAHPAFVDFFLSSSQMANMNQGRLISHDPVWQELQKHAAQTVAQLHLRDLIADGARYQHMVAEYDGIFLDFSRQLVTEQTMNLLFDLADAADVTGKIQQMKDGARINTSEDRAVMHIALRAAPQDVYKVDDQNVVPEVHAVLAKIKEFSNSVRSGAWKGATGKPLTDVVSIGIGGSYLGGEFVAEALRLEPKAKAQAKGRRLRFLANVDPVDVGRVLDGLEPETTLVVVISKTFTTAETMLNARTLRHWIISKMGERAVAKHMVAVSTALDKVAKFGIDPKNTFQFWDWVGGRYSVTSAVGVVPLALQYGFETVEQFLAGARSIDQHFINAPPRANLPILLGLLGVWNSSFLKHPARAIACYAQAMLKFAPHIQQVDMESNGKHVTVAGTPLDFDAGEVDFGEPGTNGQHSFFQLFHQGRVVPVDFIGFAQSQHPIEMKEEVVSNHDELMSNFFAQPDALATGKTVEELKADGVAQSVVPHKQMSGNRPSNVVLLRRLDAYSIGQLLALYEHRTAVQGFVWGINSFDQMGVELGKVLATQVRAQLAESRKNKDAAIKGFNPSTTALLQRYLNPKL